MIFLNESLQLPPQGSVYAPQVDWIYLLLFYVSVALFVGIVGAMLWFVFRYRRRPGKSAEPTGHNTVLELVWSLGPLIFLGFLFHWGFRAYMHTAVAPEDALEIRVRAMQWQWEFEHPNGVVEVGELKVPVKRPIKLILSSSDVIHSFFVPAFRIKKDAVPGMYTTLWFEATSLGTTQAFCTEYCGAPAGASGNAGHSNMLATVRVLTEAQYQDFLKKGPPPPPECEGAKNVAACWGGQLYAKYGCNNCHGIDGASQQPAPNWKGLFGHRVSFASGESLVADENYIRQSILEPQAKIVAGYTSVVMPPYRLSDRQIDAIIQYIRSLE